MKKYMCVSFLIMCCFVSAARAENIALLADRNQSIYELVIKEFKKAFVKETHDYFLEDFGDDINGVLSKIKALSPSLIVAIGPKSAQVARQNFSSVPIVFSLVANPSQYDLEAKNVCGVRLDVSPREQLASLKKIAPATRRVGVIYDPDRSQALIVEAREQARSLGLDIVSLPATSRSAVAEAIRNLEGKVDAVWIITDPIVANSVVLQRLLLFSLSSKVPLMCPAKPFVKQGCLFCVDVEYKDLGAQAAGIAKAIVSGEKNPEQMGIVYPRKSSLIINSKIADKLNLSLPDEILADVAELVSTE